MLLILKKTYFIIPVKFEFVDLDFPSFLHDRHTYKPES